MPRFFAQIQPLHFRCVLAYSISNAHPHEYVKYEGSTGEMGIGYCNTEYGRCAEKLGKFNQKTVFSLDYALEML